MDIYAYLYARSTLNISVFSNEDISVKSKICIKSLEQHCAHNSRIACIRGTRFCSSSYIRIFCTDQLHILASLRHWFEQIPDGKLRSPMC